MKRISVRRVASVIATAMAMTLVFATLGWAMMPQWNTRPYPKPIVIASADTTITPAHANIPHEGRYRTRETRLSIKTGDGITLPAVLREPVDAPGPRPACLFIHGSGTSGAEDFGDIANATLYGEPLTEYGKCYEALEFLIEGVLARLKEEEEQ